MSIVARREPKAEALSLERETSTPPTMVKLWAAIGAIGLAVVLTGWARWLLVSNPRPATKGTDDFPTWNLIYLRFIEIAVFIGGVYLIWHFVIRPLRRERNFTFDGMLCVACVTLWFYDPMDNYWNMSQVYNAHLINIGSWANYIPGFSYPGWERFPEPLLLISSAYAWWGFGGALICCGLLRILKRRYPSWGSLALWGATGVIIAALDTALEVFFIRGNFYAYTGAPHGWQTLWSGTQYQFPLVEGFLVFSWLAGMGALRYFRDDRGQSFVERGVDRLKVGQRGRKAIRFLAITGFVHVWFWVGYFIPWTWLVSMRADTTPKMPSYMRAELCGTGTPRACPSQYVPIPGKESIPIAPDDPRLPESVRSRQG